MWNFLGGRGVPSAIPSRQQVDLVIEIGVGLFIGLRKIYRPDWVSYRPELILYRPEFRFIGQNQLFIGQTRFTAKLTSRDAFRDEPFSILIPTNFL